MTEGLTVIGFIKCGQDSLAHMFNCDKSEIIWTANGPEDMAAHPNTIPLIIIRNPVERIWSSHQYFVDNRKLELVEFLEQEKDNPIEQCDYRYYIERFRKFNPIVFRAESLFGDNNVHRNLTQNKGDMTAEERDLITIRLKKSGVEHMYKL